MTAAIKVLLIEDNPGDAGLIKAMLAEAGAKGLAIELVWAEDLATGIEQLRTGGADVVLLDLGLPGSSGLETLRLLFAQGRQVPTLVVLSGLSDEDVAVQALQAGAQDYLVKGQVDSATLLRAIRYAIGRSQAEEALRAEIRERKQLQVQLLQSEKLASIGQLAAGVAHEINNPIGYIFSNFGTLEGYLGQLFEMLAAYESAESSVSAPDVAARLRQLREQVELEFLKDDIPVLMRESKQGIVRVRQIVQDLKDFSRVDSVQEWQWANLHQGIDSTLNVVASEIKYRADVVKEYGTVPDIECLPSQINQVVMNLVVNAAQAMGEERGRITIRTGAQGEQVWLEVADTGAGIEAETLTRIFEPFFTTKPVGKGTGLGLSVSYGIVQTHQGRVDVESVVGQGTTFRVTLPVRRPTPPTKQPSEND